jgi:hypothetical protein
VRRALPPAKHKTQFYCTAPPDPSPGAERLPAALVPEPSLVRDRDDAGPKPEPPVAPERAVRAKLETLPEEVDALASPLPPLAFEELQTANARAPTKSEPLNSFSIWLLLFIVIVQPGARITAGSLSRKRAITGVAAANLPRTPVGDDLNGARVLP